MLYGQKLYNDLLMEPGHLGMCNQRCFFRRATRPFTLKNGWPFPRKVDLNGDECMFPPHDSCPFLPNSAHGNLLAIATFICFFDGLVDCYLIKVFENVEAKDNLAKNIFKYSIKALTSFKNQTCNLCHVLRKVLKNAWIL